MFNKDLEEIKKSQLIMKNAITEMKSTLEGTNSRITESEDRISEMEDRMVEINEAERKKEKRIKRNALVWRQENPVFHSSCKLELGIALQSLQGKRDLI